MSTKNVESDSSQAPANKDQPLETKVHSANDWENADLGDHGRKEKFLKLMGASKTEHKGKIVIGESSAKHKGDDPSQMNKKLENQFQQGLDHKMNSGGRKRHLGLGYQPESGDQPPPSADSQKAHDVSASVDDEAVVDAKPDSDVVEERQRVNDEESAAQQEETTDNGSTKTIAEEPASKKKAMCGFVKASSDISS